MKLHELLEPLGYETQGLKNTEISSITDDSRKVEKNSLFVAIKGSTVDGHKFIKDAVASGATAVVGEAILKKENISDFTYIRVKNSRKALGQLASHWYGNPGKKLRVIGITGTDGKTTTTNLIYWILKKSGKKVGTINTINAKIGNREYDTGLHVTSPDSISLQKFLAKMVNEDVEVAVLEVTSHAIAQERIAGVDFDMAVLTNITHEHIDYHKNFSSYREIKSRLFEKAGICVLNEDDDSFKYLKEKLDDKKKVITYSIKNRSSDVYAKDIEEKGRTTIFTCLIDKSAYEFNVPLTGNYNVSNSLAAIGTCLELGIDSAEIKSALANFPGIAGRLERVENDKEVEIYVDFAHTPNSLKNVLKTLKKSTNRRLITVFGSAGERDAGKRSMMGEVSAELADICVFTAEDPRNEDVNAIIDQMAVGAKKAGAKEIKPDNKDINELIHRSSREGSVFVRIPERGEAIAFAIQKLAEKGDTVVVCGKGHEKSMAYNGIEYPWSDQDAVKMALEGEVKEIKRE